MKRLLVGLCLVFVLSVPATFAQSDVHGLAHGGIEAVLQSSALELWQATHQP